MGVKNDGSLDRQHRKAKTEPEAFSCGAFLYIFAVMLPLEPTTAAG
jgi:hypothetical protein